MWKIAVILVTSLHVLLIDNVWPPVTTAPPEPVESATGPAKTRRVTNLIELLRNDEAFTRYQAAHQLGLLGREASQACPALERVLEDLNAEVRIQAALALWRIDKRRSVVDTMVQGLRSTDSSVQSDSAFALGEVGPDGKNGISALIILLESQDGEVSMNACHALGKMGKVAAPALADSLASTHRNTRFRAAEGLSLMAQGDGRDAMNALIKALKDPEEGVRIQASLAIGNIREGVRAGVPALKACLGDSNRIVRLHAARAICQVDCQDGEALAILRAALRDKERTIRGTAAWILAELAAEDKEFIPDIAGLLKDKDAEVRELGACMLGRIGKPANSALAALIEALNDQDSTVQHAAADALRRISPELARAHGIETERK